MEIHCGGVFEQKAVENFRASDFLYQNNLYNAASNRIYYCLIHAAMASAFKYGASEDCYLTMDTKNKTKKIDKTKIEQNIRGMGITQVADFRKLLSHAKSIRIKADYLNFPVAKEELDGTIPKLEDILKLEGVMT